MTAKPFENDGGFRAGGRFDATRWSLIGRAQEGSETALNDLLKTYRGPLIEYVRSRIGNPHDAEDLVHEFIAAKVVGRDFLGNVAAGKGRFRTFLLKAIQNYLVDDHRGRHAAKRIPEGLIQSTGEEDEGGQPVTELISEDPAPDAEFDRQWVAALVGAAREALRRECERADRLEILNAVEAHLFQSEDSPPLGEIARRLGIEEGAIRVAVHRLRKRLRSLIIAEVRDTVSNPEDFKDEYAYLISLFAP